MVKFIFLFLFFSINISAEIFQTKGEVYIEFEGDKNACLDDARDKAYDNALEKFAGESIVSSKELTCTSNDDEALCELKKRTSTLTRGIIKQVSEGVPDLKVDGGFWLCTWKQDVVVEKLKMYPDFEFRFSLNQNKFIAPLAPLEGIKKTDERFKSITISFAPKQPSYLYLFQNTDYLKKGKSFLKIFPNKLDQENFFTKKVTIPTKKNYEFKVSFPDNLFKDVYYVNVFAIASESKISFYDEYTYEDFQAKLFEIMEQKSRFKSAIYTVLKKD